MILKLIIIILSVILIAIFINSVEEYNRKNRSKISFKESMDLTEIPVVTFYNGDKKLNFLLDTGSNMSHINSSVLNNLEYEKIDNSTEIIGMEGNSLECSSFCTMNISYKNQKFNEEFSIIDLDKAFEAVKKESGVQVHGILGSKFFEKYRYILDFNELIAYIK